MTRGQGMAGLLGMLPGVGRQIKNMKVDERQFDRVEAIILSMTPYERRNPKLIDGSRRRRIAAGAAPSAAGEPVLPVKLGQKMMKQVGKSKMMKPGRAAGEDASRFPGCRRTVMCRCHGDPPSAGTVILR